MSDARRTLVSILGCAIAACGPSGEPLTVHYTFVTSGEKSCGPQAQCDDIGRSCDAVALLRVVDPDNPASAPYNQCKDIPNFRDDLCPLAEVGFDAAGSIPTDRMEVQLAIYARGDLPVDETGLPVCPASVRFTATGFASPPPDNSIQPALSGRAFADGYTTEVVIELGCHDTTLIDNEVCRNEDKIDITASVIDMETQVSVSSGTSARLIVRAGEPRQSDLESIIDSTSSVELLLQAAPEPYWLARDVEIGMGPGQVDFIEHACLQVLEDLPGRTATLTCRPAVQPHPNAVDLGGVLVAKPTLDTVLTALGLAEFPSMCPEACGLVLGIVVDETGAPVAGLNVFDSAIPPVTEVRYLSADRSTTVGITETTTSGLFVSTNAPFLTAMGPNEWRVSGTPAPIQINTPVGGIVSNRLSVVVIVVQRP